MSFSSPLVWFSHLVVSDSWDPTDCSLPVSSVHGISQARILEILEWVANFFSRDLFHSGIEPRSPVLQADSLLTEPPGQFPSLKKKSICIRVLLLYNVVLVSAIQQNESAMPIHISPPF